MATALECWSSRASTDEDLVEQVLMRTQDRSEGSKPESSFAVGAKESSAMQKRLQRLSRNVSEAVASLKNSLNLDSARDPSPTKIEGSKKAVWGSVVRNLTQLYPGSQLPEKLVSNIRKHYDSLPLSYAQAGFEMKDVFLHIKLIEQASVYDHPAILFQEVTNHDTQKPTMKFTFACNSSISWSAMSGALESAGIRCEKIQIFEKKRFTLGVVLFVNQDAQEKFFKSKIESALKLAIKKPKTNTVKLPFGFCGCQEGNARGKDLREIEEDAVEQNCRSGFDNSNLNEWQTVQCGGHELGKWLLSSENLEFTDQIGPNSFKGVYKGKRVAIEKIKGCEKGIAYKFELRKDLLELMTCGHKNILMFYGVCIDENHGLCVVTKLMEGGSVHELMLKNKRFQTKEITRIGIDVAEGIKFMNDHGVAYRDLNAQRILLDKNGSACLGDMGILTACKNLGEAMEYETDGYRWLAPEIIAGDPESVNETWMSNAYSFGMVIWEMVSGEAAYGAYSPVQAAVGIAACGLRPDLPKDCPSTLKSLMIKCWNTCPSKRPQFSEILSVLLDSNNNNHR
ncbi:dual specificity protein kinase shkB isoform X2 [Momordica charantia]|uniref:Dual specificity protein kinase shkB isoform X2 n=1 Tax=Momordica charantia TaxID=3673 RepID=A0A6J1D401_MOMCH|nr:dual specificity protein kinase shkB isoform X2 [Momordica charantia]